MARLSLLFGAGIGSAEAFVPPHTTSCVPKFVSSSLHLQTLTELQVDNGQTPQERSQKAIDTWSTVALHPTSNVRRKEISLSGESTTVYNQRLFDEFTSIKGTYFMNGLASCKIGNRLIHPFEAHGHCKSLVFDGQGKMYYTSNIVETPLTKKERAQNRIINRGVMSTVADLDSLWGNIQNALSSSERDTASLTADLWPPPFTKNGDGIDPLLITLTDNGEPYALDPNTLQMKGKLIDVVPKLASVFRGNKCLAHSRYDEANNRFIMCINNMIIPGEDFKGNVQMEFVEFDDNFDVVSRRQHTTRFMVFHDWALTENYYVVPKNPAYLKWRNIAKFVVGLGLGTDVFAMEEETPGEFILIPRHGTDDDVKEIQSDVFFNCFHFGPVYENDDELIINGCIFDSYSFGGEMGFNGDEQSFSPIEWGSTGLANGAQAPAPRLDQFVVDTSKTPYRLKSKERVPVIPVDMPSFNGNAKFCRYSYFLGASRPEGWFPFRQIVRLNMETFESFVYDAGYEQVVSEPMYIPKNNPTSSSDDEGFVLSFFHDAINKQAKIVVWESASFSDGPIAVIAMGDFFPWCVHGSGFYKDYIPFESVY
ncbi:predicted protein [Thalassiosira pseudonana CCMP1335]|jgi:carotenoid cleavage dioxygenase-like enzyme|uniref:Uncharacterized protein n=1 Tax=Thalassiosira pseudonana TaxID=35128 RepID=B8C6K5_THAPS|nr:predicted protein [Thalassiosira pseudonana CCMP1335]EED90585.1 predicted protein [Thalassiosira pseudonana CCMP1335]|eukprot:scaffold2575_cov214-Alexandrium_tamarense.AAC.7